MLPVVESLYRMLVFSFNSKNRNNKAMFDGLSTRPMATARRNVIYAAKPQHARSRAAP